MDGKRFDTVARTLGGYMSRRASLRALVGAVVTAVLVQSGLTEVAAACKKPGKKCNKKSDCCSKRCKKGRCRCAKVNKPCAGTPDCCGSLRCKKGRCRCAKVNKPCAGTADCCGSLVCGGNGRCKRLELCSVPGSACFDHDECCSDICGDPDDAGKMVCCVNNADRCDQTSDCCEGSNTQSVCQAGRCCRDEGAVCFAPGSQQAATCCFGLVCNIQGAFGHCEVNVLP